jgi:hypothetical protein
MLILVAAQVKVAALSVVAPRVEDLVRALKVVKAKAKAKTVIKAKKSIMASLLL